MDRGRFRHFDQAGSAWSSGGVASSRAFEAGVTAGGVDKIGLLRYKEVDKGTTWLIMQEMTWYRDITAPGAPQTMLNIAEITEPFDLDTLLYADAVALPSTTIQRFGCECEVVVGHVPGSATVTGHIGFHCSGAYYEGRTGLKIEIHIGYGANRDYYIRTAALGPAFAVRCG
jgi:hypothetical protein